MRIDIVEKTTERRLELHFSSRPSKVLSHRIFAIGFRKRSKDRLTWDIALRPAYLNYAKELQQAFQKNIDWQDITLHPSYTPNAFNIHETRFSIVEYEFSSPEGVAQEVYVVFEPIKIIATFIAAQYGEKRYGDRLEKTDITPRNKKDIAKKLFEQGKIIDTLKDVSLIGPKSASPCETPNPILLPEITDSNRVPNETPQKQELNKETTPIKIPLKETTALQEKDLSDTEAIMNTKKNYTLGLLLNSVIQELSKEGESIDIKFKSLLDDIINKLFDANEQDDLNTQQQIIKKGVALYRDRYSDASPKTITFQILRLIEFLGDAPLVINHIPTKKRTLRAEIADNMFIPKGVGTHFAFDHPRPKDAAVLHKKYPHLANINTSNLSTTSINSLFEMLQLSNPIDFGFSVEQNVLRHFLKTNAIPIFKELNLPLSPHYPYINVVTHFRNVQPLQEIIGTAFGKQLWWLAISKYRPIKDMDIALAHIEELLEYAKADQQQLINPQTQKPKKKSKYQYKEIKDHISRLKRSQAHILNYKKERSQRATPSKTKPVSKGYICAIVAIMHEHYAKEQRLSKRKIEALQQPTQTPTLGKLWEAVELSWLLWYRQLYVQLTPFEVALKAMIRFWNITQPTYAYSDSSKERFKQYSTPCIIGAMLAKYTRMDTAQSIFEPSAGNGLLLVGADPAKTIVNEIDSSRRDSLMEQQFKEVHAKNAAVPFPKAWTKQFDVVVTNPPFAPWEEPLFDKKRLVSKYFNKHHELVRYMRLEHYMAGLALRTLKDTGKAAIIIMGHLYFNDQGYIAKYAPFYKWLARHYIIDDIINLNGFKIYAKQGAVARTMLILIGGRKTTPSPNFPTKHTHPHLDTIVDSFEALWTRIKFHTNPLEKLIQQLKIAHS